jgi:hypothetical protein
MWMDTAMNILCAAVIAGYLAGFVVAVAKACDAIDRR